MSAYLIRRLFQGFFVLIVGSLVIYLLLTLVPGGPFEGLQMANQRITQADIRRLETLYGLRDPNTGREYSGVERYFRWLFNPDREGVDFYVGPLHVKGAGVLTGDFGESQGVARGVPVMDTIRSRLPNTLILAISSIGLSLLIALPIGVIAAIKQYSKLDYAVTMFSFFGLSMPTFWLGLMVVVVFAVQFKSLNQDPTSIFHGWLPYFPPNGLPDDPGDIVGRLYHLVLPVSVLAFVNIAGWSRYIRAAMLEVLRQDYVRTAWAKGLKQRIVIMKHALRNALIPVITLIGLSVPALFGGAIVTESIFTYPGMGQLYLNGINTFDWPVVMGFLIISTALVVVGNIISDVLYAVADPRIRYS